MLTLVGRIYKTERNRMLVVAAGAIMVASLGTSALFALGTSELPLYLIGTVVSLVATGLVSAIMTLHVKALRRAFNRSQSLEYSNGVYSN